MCETVNSVFKARHTCCTAKEQSFSGTIKDNLLMGDRSADDRDIDFALKVSQSAEFVSKLKDGTNTLIEEKSKICREAKSSVFA